MIGRRVLMILSATLVCLAIVGVLVLAIATLPPAQGQREDGAGTGYRLTSQSLRADGILSGPGYRLQSAITGTGTPCCCVYLPCTVHSFP